MYMLFSGSALLQGNVYLSPSLSYLSQPSMESSNQPFPPAELTEESFLHYSGIESAGSQFVYKRSNYLTVRFTIAGKEKEIFRVCVCVIFIE